MIKHCKVTLTYTLLYVIYQLMLTDIGLLIYQPNLGGSYLNYSLYSITKLGLSFLSENSLINYSNSYAFWDICLLAFLPRVR